MNRMSVQDQNLIKKKRTNSFRNEKNNFLNNF